MCYYRISDEDYRKFREDGHYIVRSLFDAEVMDLLRLGGMPP